MHTERILQITDSHLLGDRTETFLGIDSLKTLQAVIRDIKIDIEKIKPKLIVLTGDLSHDKTVLSYQYLVKEISLLNCPTAWIPGNHDDLKNASKLNEAQNLTKKKLFTINSWKIILLNSLYPDHISGKLSKEELSFLEKSLQENTDENIMIFIHHHLLPVGNQWLNKLGVENAKSFFSIIDNYKEVKAVICGHVHQETAFKRNNVDYISTPSTSVQFSKKCDDFALDTLMPGYRWINLNSDNSFSTGVCRIKQNNEFTPDQNIVCY